MACFLYDRDLRHERIKVNRQNRCFIKKRPQHSRFPGQIAKFLKTFFYRTSQVAASYVCLERGHEPDMR